MKTMLFTFALLIPVVAHAQTQDSSASATRGFLKKVEASRGMIIKVPVNERGEENIGAAEMRIHVAGTKVKDAPDLAKIWTKSESVKSQSTVNSTNKVDSSTCGWWYHRHHRTRWVAPRVYYTYAPTYYYYGATYAYTYAYTYPVVGYRYYYYW